MCPYRLPPLAPPTTRRSRRTAPPSILAEMFPWYPPITEQLAVIDYQGFPSSGYLYGKAIWQMSQLGHSRPTRSAPALNYTALNYKAAAGSGRAVVGERAGACDCQSYRRLITPPTQLIQK